jgi:hypothetical protein
MHHPASARRLHPLPRSGHRRCRCRRGRVRHLVRPGPAGRCWAVRKASAPAGMSLCLRGRDRGIGLPGGPARTVSRSAAEDLASRQMPCTLRSVEGLPRSSSWASRPHLPVPRGPAGRARHPFRAHAPGGPLRRVLHPAGLRLLRLTRRGEGGWSGRGEVNPQDSSGRISMEPQGHSAAHRPQPLQ